MSPPHPLLVSLPQDKAPALPPKLPVRFKALGLRGSHVCTGQSPAPTQGSPCRLCDTLRPEWRLRSSGRHRALWRADPCAQAAPGRGGWPWAGAGNPGHSDRPGRQAGPQPWHTACPGLVLQLLSGCPSGNKDPFMSRLPQSQQLWRRRTKGPFHRCWAGSTAACLPEPRGPPPGPAWAQRPLAQPRQSPAPLPI